MAAKLEAKLRRSPLVEALLELHFNKASDYLAYGLIPGQMYAGLRGSYPNASELETARIPIDLESPALVRHRFFSADEARLYQVGNGILTCNVLRYETYADFKHQVAEVVPQAVAIMGRPRLAILRYINKVPRFGRDLANVLQVTIQLPIDVQISSQSAVIAHFTAAGESKITWSAPVDNDEDLILLDLQVTSAPLAEASHSEAVLEWMDLAHNEIESTFLRMLDPGLLEELR